MGQVIKRDERAALSGGDPHEVWYRFSGKQIGYVGNNGTMDTDYASSIANRTAGSCARRGKTSLQPRSGKMLHLHRRARRAVWR